MVRQAADGDRLAFETIYLHNQQSLLRFICKHYPSLGEPAAEDAVSEVFLRAWQDHSRLRCVNNLEAYLKTMAKNGIAHRSRANRPAEVELSADAASSAPSPHAALEQKTLAHQINQAIVSLARSRRLAFELSRDGRSAKQIASIAHCTENATRLRLQKARQDLARALSRCGHSCAVDEHRPEQCPAKKENLYCLKWSYMRGLRANP